MMSFSTFLLQALIIFNIYSAVTSADNETLDAFIEMSSESLHKIRQGILRASVGNPEVLQAYEMKKSLQSSKIVIHQNIVTDILQDSLSISMENFTQCNTDLIYTVESLKQTWAIQMLDAFAKPPSGILRGHVNWPGSYDECLKIVAPPGDISTGFKGRHAWLTLTFIDKSTNVSENLLVGACLPGSCAEDQSIPRDYTTLLTYLSKISFLKKYLSNFPLLRISFLPVDYPLDAASVACIVICSLFTALAACGTIVDVVRRYQVKEAKNHSEKFLDQSNVDTNALITEDDGTSSINSTVAETSDVPLIISRDKKSLVGDFLLCFSFITNTESILDTTSGQGHLQCLHGIRFLSMAWVILGHTYYFSIGSYENILDLLDLLNVWPFQVILQGTYSVDTFFLLSGCLMTYLFLKNKHLFTGIKPWVMFYVHRYVRLTPVYAMLLFILATWWNSVGDGPFWSTFYKDTCARTWWWNILYINNFLEALDMCMGWAWYLANDMQFFVISPIFLIAFKRSRIAGFTIVLTLLVASWIATGIIAREHNLPSVFNNMSSSADFDAKQRALFSLVYVKPHTRIGPYLIGVLVGFAVYEVNGKQRFLHKSVVVFGWLASQAMSLTLLYGTMNANLGPITSSAHIALGRSTWAITVGWVMYACLTGHAGPVNHILSWKIWIPLSRLTYCAYLIHPAVMMWYFYTLRTTLYFSTALIVSMYLSFLTLSYGLAFIASLLFEAPIMKLEKFVKKL